MFIDKKSCHRLNSVLNVHCFFVGIPPQIIIVVLTIHALQVFKCRHALSTCIAAGIHQPTSTSK